MLNRREYKFLLARTDLAEFRSMILPYLELDKYAAARPGGEYLVKSIYYDTPDLVYYKEKLAGILRRKKIRIRAYNQLQDKDNVFFEIKRKNDLFIKKDRYGIPFNSLLNDQNGNGASHTNGESGTHSFDSPEVRAFHYHLVTKRLIPIVTVAYEREAYVGKFSRLLRITLDKNLRSMAMPDLADLARDTGYLPAMTQHIIVEFKFSGHMPRWIQPILTKYALTRQALSKYVICVDNHPEIYSNAPMVRAVSFTAKPFRSSIRPG